MNLVLIMVAVTAQACDLAVANQILPKLGSASFAERQRAEAWFRERPATAPVLRQALKNSDSEVKRRAVEILDFHSERRAEAVARAVDTGNFDKATLLISTWPKDEGEELAWKQTWRLTKKIVDESSRKMNGTIFLGGRIPAWEKRARDVFVDDFRPDTPPTGDTILFARGKDAVWRTDRRKLNLRDICSVATGNVEIVAPSAESSQCFIYSGGSTKMTGPRMVCSIIVSSGDIQVGSIGNCIVIARGKISAEMAIGCHLISGETVRTTGGMADCIVSENDCNPLGLIRWSAQSRKE